MNEKKKIELWGDGGSMELSTETGEKLLARAKDMINKSSKLDTWDFYMEQLPEPTRH